MNDVHPFRDGNGRTQFVYLEQLAARTGHPILLTSIDPGAWLSASCAAHNGDYGLMAAEIARCLADKG